MTMAFETGDEDEFVEKYNQLVEKTFNRFRDEFQDPDSDWNFQDSEGDYFEIAWDLAQDTYIKSYTDDLALDIKIAEVAVNKDRDQSVDWGEAKRRIVEHGFPRTHDSISDFSPTRLASWASDEIINHAVATDVMRKFEDSG